MVNREVSVLTAREQHEAVISYLEHRVAVLTAQTAFAQYAHQVFAQASQELAEAA
jgi:hypothetical protein